MEVEDLDNGVDANLRVLKERIEVVKMKEKLGRCCRYEYGWNYAKGMFIIIELEVIIEKRGWTTKARVTKKQKLRHFKNARGEGKDFSFNLLNSIIEAGKVYLISEGSLKLAQKEYNDHNNDHQILLASTKIVQQCSEDDDMIPRQQFLYHKVSDFSGKEVGTIPSTQQFINPDFPKVRLSERRRNTLSASIAREKSSRNKTDNRKTISQIKDERLGTSEKPDWITVVAVIAYIELDNFYYPACPFMDGCLQCNKKVTENVDGKWWCDKCDYRYVIQLQIQDHTGTTWVIAFEESGESLIGVSAKDLYCLKHEDQNVEKFKEIMHQVLFNKYTFKLKVKEENFNSKSTVVNVDVNFASESKYLWDLIYKSKANDFCPLQSKGKNYTNGTPLEASVGRTLDLCYKCHRIGHWATDCPRRSYKGV
ncbi:hypothetical protein GOBAR_DD20491 [Gossypium barbadense]|nr:hypothetical protein GOBAR_DD20491 [Gossypium barbadense]